MQTFKLPPAIRGLVTARNSIRAHYAEKLKAGGHTAELSFTLDGNLVGDIGEALAMEYFGVRLVDRGAQPGIDGYAPDGRTVQVKATGTDRGPVFRQIEQRADHLLFFKINFESEPCIATVEYNGPEEPLLKTLPEAWTGQRMVSTVRLQLINDGFSDDERLQLVKAI